MIALGLDGDGNIVLFGEALAPVKKGEFVRLATDRESACGLLRQLAAMLGDDRTAPPASRPPATLGPRLELINGDADPVAEAIARDQAAIAARSVASTPTFAPAVTLSRQQIEDGRNARRQRLAEKAKDDDEEGTQDE